ncbi:hypothetical protein B0H11DRAFT_667198 [Mycena galericulata]|nr:hypothetical protein B0H11DRAFT_667198 [Mycena galericulata]
MWRGMFTRTYSFLVHVTVSTGINPAHTFYFGQCERILFLVVVHLQRMCIGQLWPSICPFAARHVPSPSPLLPKKNEERIKSRSCVQSTEKEKNKAEAMDCCQTREAA